jgi:hypothetical protein
MEPLAAQHFHEHIADIHREVAADRLARAVISARRRSSRRPAPKIVVRLVSNGLMFVATRLDPNLRRPSYGRE